MRSSHTIVLLLALVALASFALAEGARPQGNAAIAVRKAMMRGAKRNAMALSGDHDDDHHDHDDHDHDGHNHDDHDHDDHNHDDHHHDDHDHDHDGHDHDDHDHDHDDHDHDDHDHDDHDHDGHDHNGHDHNGHDHDGHDHHHHHHDHDHGLEGSGAIKLMSILVLFSLSMAVAGLVIFLPACACVSSSASDTILSLLSMFSAGVFLSIGLAHLLGDGADILLIEYGMETHERYRPAYAVALLGYIIMVVIQKGLFGGSHCHGSQSQAHNAAIDADAAKADDAAEKQKHNQPDHNCADHEIVEQVPPAVNGAAIQEDPESSSPNSTTKVNVAADAAINDQDDTAAELASAEGPTAPRTIKTGSLVASLVALLIHSFVEGVALGLQSTTEGAVLMFVAIITHQWGEDIAIAAASGKTAYSRPVRMGISGVLAAACPIGIGIGWAVQSSLPSKGTGYAFAFSAGTFMYIAATEVLSEELPAHAKRSPWSRIAAFLAGLLIMYGIYVGAYNEEAHNH